MSKGRILLVGGDPDITRTIQVYLDAHHFSIQAVKRGEEALAICRQSLPEAVIVSWHPPDLSGDELCQGIRAVEGGDRSFVLALLPTSARDTRLAALEAGADEVMCRPIDLENLRLRIEGRL
jgi:DNA-binding response OmpR family regulator